MRDARRGNIVLIITAEFDPHADLAVRRLSELGVPVVRWHTADFPVRSTASFSFQGDDDLDGILSTNSRQVRLGDVRSAWYRRPGRAELPADLDPHWVDFTKEQVNHFSNGLWHALKCFWISLPAAIQAAELKINQLQLANQLGFVIPRTLITNDVDQARQFCRHHDKNGVVYKPLRVPPVVTVSKPDSSATRVPAVPLLYTTPLSSEHLDHLDSVKWAPGIFQEYVPKAFELRITVVAGELFAVEIHSQEHPRTIHDWRRYPDDLDEVRHVPHTLPSKLNSLLITLVERLGLNFGAIDMIVRPDGEYVFLEINPNGQFLWIEELTGLPIMESLVQALIRSGPSLR